jgi:AcrR family transcriptional regulator
MRPVPDVEPAGPRWEESALQRSLASARARSSAHARRVVEAARELAAQVGPSFTVQQVAARAGVSLKTLYRNFSGKDGLLLAVFEEDNRIAADLLGQMIASHESSVDRLRAFILGLFELATARPHEDYIVLVMREYFRLAQAHSERVEHVLTPFVDLLTAELEAAAAHGALQVRDPRREAAAVFLVTVAHLCPLVLADQEADAADTAEFVATFCLRALGASG